jgi:hypothetical protein
MGQVPCLATTALFKACEHQLGAHGTVPYKAALERGFVKEFFVWIQDGLARSGWFRARLPQIR